MIRKLLAICGVLLLTGCGSPTDQPSAQRPPAAPVPPPAPASVAARFECESGFVRTTFHADHVVLELSDRTLTLPHLVAASGARYGDGTTTFWNKGNEATLELDGRTQSCRVLADPWQNAGERGIDFRAVGQEPGWYLEIDDGKSMRLFYDYAERLAATPVPVPVSNGGTTTYDAVTEAHRLRVVIEERECSDTMSGERFPRTVTVTLDGRSLHGCGRSL